MILNIEEKATKGEGKLLFFAKLKDHFGTEEYLLMMTNAKLRKKITQLRLSAHKLEIEVGRHKNVKREERFCQHCRMGKIESEEHFLFECPNYSKEREDFRAQIGATDKFNGETEGIEMLREIFRCKDETVFNIFGKFAHNLEYLLFLDVNSPSLCIYFYKGSSAL